MRRWVKKKIVDFLHRSVFFDGIIAGIWEAMELLNTMQDDSDPDVRKVFFFC